MLVCHEITTVGIWNGAHVHGLPLEFGVRVDSLSWTITVPKLARAVLTVDSFPLPCAEHQSRQAVKGRALR